MFARPFDLLLGRKTYDIFAAHWPYVGADDPIGPMFDRINKYVATRNPALELAWQNSHALRPDAVAAVRQLKREDGPDLLTQGSTDFLKTLFDNDLVDELNVSFFPLVLGTGKRRSGGTFHGAFQLVASTASASASGVVVNRYVRAGDIVTGSFEFEQPTEAELERRRRLT
ncbi:dihydrofolate reductase family protein [Xanthomonas graminis]|uniref:Dihydrofolate reductase n=1 Tax=Xanthomonas graminis pv. arrhenatheri LMG 727 TaxID=1195923 RepID=A0A0K2ZCL4_9XANT|nr:dihydrofolate reductase family protein [Xanthomonas translucens]UKE79466.1 dihydrofolate reductase family protein [Xanthomonas translucens pv. arrhenatheri]CTP83036.1 dihydrofolate reductase [Xanthomonas translucens pv. arrhenatheri LMG 727]